MVTNHVRRARRPYLILARWLSVICCGVVAAATILAFEPLARRLGEPLANRIGVLSPMQALALLSVLAFTGCWFVGRGRWRGFLGVRFVLTYPPLSVAVISGFSAWVGGTLWLYGAAHMAATLDDVLWFGSQVPTIAWQVIMVGLAALTLATLLPDIGTVLRRNRANPSARDQSRPRRFDALRTWLKDDSEIATPAEDRFRHNEVAQRVAFRLAQPDEAPTMAVIGMLGSGKSTIRRLVAHHLRNRPKVRLIDVSVWPFDSAEAAVRGILRAIIQELGRHVNILPLAGLSNDYITAIEKSAGGYGGIAHLLRGASDPKQILQRFSSMACATGLRIVLWIEDLERFSGGDQLRGESRIEREVERLGPIRALLHLLDRCPQISVVVSDTSLRTRFDLGKIARFVEQLPAMEVEDVWRDTSLLRESCLGGYPTRIIDPAAPEVRASLTLEGDEHRISAWLSSFRDSDSGIPAAIARTLQTPRALKSALRITLETWEKIPGEIDFDSVMVASVLRVARPDLFALVSDHIALFRQGLTNPFSGSGEREPHPVVKQIDDLLATEGGRMAGSLRTLLSYVFPKYPPGGTGNDREYVSQPQALFVDRYSDYWRRYLAQEPVVEAKSDQLALRSVIAWRNREASDLIDRLVDTERSDQIEQFVGQFRPAELCRLLRDISDQVAPQSAAGWEGRRHAPGIVAAWRMMLERQPEEALVFQTVSDIVRRTSPTNLPLAHEVTVFFAASSSGVRSLISDAQRNIILRSLQGALTENFIGGGAEDRLLRACKDGSPWLIAWVTRIAPPVGKASLPFDRWPEFASVLLNLAEAHPTIGVPLVVPFFIRGDRSTVHRQNDDGEPELVHEWFGQFDLEAARLLFDFDRLIRILARFELPNTLGEQMTAYCRSAVETAREHTVTALDSPAPDGADSRPSSP